MSALPVTQVRLRAYPTGPVGPETWQITHDAPAAPGPNQVLLQMHMLSIDPGMRGWIAPKRSYMPPVKPGEVMRGFGVGTVLESNAKAFAPGDVVTGLTGIHTTGVVDAMFNISQPITSANFWCPPMHQGRLDGRLLGF